VLQKARAILQNASQAGIKAYLEEIPFACFERAAQAVHVPCAHEEDRSAAVNQVLEALKAPNMMFAMLNAVNVTFIIPLWVRTGGSVANAYKMRRPEMVANILWHIAEVRAHCPMLYQCCR